MVAAATVGAAVVGGVASSSAAKKGAKASQGASDAAATQAAIAQDQWDTYKKTYQPLEEGLVADAQKYDTVEAQEEAAGLASSTVASQFGKARERLSRTPGLDPSSGAYAAALGGLERDQAAADATGQNAARQRVEDTAYARKLDAVSLGKGLPASASTGLAQAAATQTGIANANNAQAAQIGNSVGGLAYQAISNWPSSTGATGAGSLTSNANAALPTYAVSPGTAPTTDLSGIYGL